MRLALVLASFLVAAPALAQDARVAFLTKQLTTSKDPRLRAQTAVILGASGSPAAVKPLCAALQDGEAVVRAAAASALGEIGNADAKACAQGALKDVDEAVRAAAKRAVDAQVIKQGGLYVSIETSMGGGVSPDLGKVADQLLRLKLQQMGAAFAPQGEQKDQASALVRQRKLKSYLLKVSLTPQASNGLRIEMLVMTYPDQALRGSFNVKASGAKPESLLKAMVPRVVDDAAEELSWGSSE